MSQPMTPEKMALYSASARSRREAKRVRVAARRDQAWDLACRAARMLRQDFGARRVDAFGSLVRPDAFHLRSDVDLAAWGIPEDAYLLAVAKLLSLDNSISVDLVRAEEAPSSLLEAVEREGVAL